MSRPLIVSIPHRFGRQEARRRLDAGIARLRPELGVFLSRLDYHREDDTPKFIASAVWQQITGRIEVLDDAVRVEIDLPMGDAASPRYHCKTSTRPRGGSAG